MRFGKYEIKPQETRPSYPDAILAVCQELVAEGVREVGNNSGPWVDKFLAFVGVTEPSPWCTAVACWVLQEAAKRIGASDDTCPDVASGAKLWRWAIANPDKCDRLLRPEDARPGDVLIMGATVEKARRIARGGLASGHTLIIGSDVGKDGLFTTYEGNTNAEGSREGQGFYKRARSWSEPRIVGAIRFYVVV